ncbi:DUF6429 family protein [Paracoccus laeviglucosivorans]|uniref:DUF6429 domain-containing protein n=1 Tax=Paracoccus laeviglucosivorans TaxID=1197861 RepID=A0A521FQ49_9RHOB|nr:DUF6429 family protein [Paracoccus laeviglucosivorans]SMO97591.1 hypothetical protein SAMN06265221_12828 [Paracoccus laeviglucosivorans]
MQLDHDKIDDAVMALLCLTLHDRNRAWKGFDWTVLARLHRKGYITNPVNRAKSVQLTQAGMDRAEALFQTMFVMDGNDDPA